MSDVDLDWDTFVKDLARDWADCLAEKEVLERRLKQYEMQVSTISNEVETARFRFEQADARLKYAKSRKEIEADRPS